MNLMELLLDHITNRDFVVTQIIETKAEMN
jgi:hypothetical protein